MKAIALDVEVYDDWSSKVSRNLSGNGRNEKVDVNSTWCSEPLDIAEVSTFHSGESENAEGIYPDWSGYRFGGKRIDYLRPKTWDFKHYGQTARGAIPQFKLCSSSIQA